MVGDLTWAEASHDSPFGRIASRWKREKDAIQMSVSIPPGTTATVYVPAKAPSDVKEGGRPATQAAGVKFLRMAGDRAVFEVESGDYDFSAEDRNVQP